MTTSEEAAMAEHYFVIRHQDPFRVVLEHVVNDVAFAEHSINLEHYEFDHNIVGAFEYLAELADSLAGVETRWEQLGGEGGVLAVSDRITL